MHSDEKICVWGDIDKIEPGKIEATGQYYTPYLAGDDFSSLIDGHYDVDYPMFQTFGTAELYIDIATALVTEVKILLLRTGYYPGKYTRLSIVAFGIFFGLQDQVFEELLTD